MPPNNRFDQWRQILNENQGVTALLAFIVSCFALFNFRIDIFLWPAIFSALPLESKMWYLWIFNVFLLIVIGILLNAKINRIDSNR